MSSAAAPRAAGSGMAARLKDLVLPLAMVASVLVIVAPLPSGLMDLLLAANITVAVIMLLTSLYVRSPLEFSVFPSLLLATTLFRLVLNVATTRLILSRAGSEGLLAAGGVVKTFGEFVAGGGEGAERIVVGLVIFIIIVIIQFVVITKGASRISEVAARFTLDGMPGKQMAIDADLAAGAIDQPEAQRRRREIAQQADFFGAMDGAGKFVRGDAVAGLAITFINIVGGLVIGIGQYGMGLGEAGRLFTTLTIGDGLVTQVPAFLISLAAGMLVTRGNQPGNLPGESVRQLFSRPPALAIAGAFLYVLMFTSLPPLPLALIGTASMGLALVIARDNTKQRVEQEKRQARADSSRQQRAEDYLAVDPLELELGVGLIRLADPRRGGDLIERIQGLRREIATEIGVLLPKVRVRDNLRLQPNQYRLKIADLPVDQGAIDPRVGDPAGKLISQLGAVVSRRADELLSRDALKHLIDQLRRTHPAAVDELLPGMMKLGEVQQVLQLLLREGVPIRQLSLILETLADHAPRTRDPFALVEAVRRRLAGAICGPLADARGRLHVVTLSPELEDMIFASAETSDDGTLVRLPPETIGRICRAIAEGVERLVALGRPPVVLTAPRLRPLVKQLTAARLPRLTVLGHGEIARDVRVQSVAVVSIETSNESESLGAESELAAAA
jgi:flagellar biosynthesis protein FlhA